MLINLLRPPLSRDGQGLSKVPTHQIALSQLGDQVLEDLIRYNDQL